MSAHTPILRSGRAVRTYGVALALSAHRGLDLLYARFEGESPDRHFLAIPGIELHEVLPSRGIARMRSYTRARLAGAPSALARGVSPELVDAAACLAEDPARGRVIADGPTVAAALIGLARRRPVIYNAHNLESAFRHELEGGPRLHNALPSFERKVLATYRESWMVSEQDMQGARELCPQARLRYAPNVLDLAAIHPIDPAVQERRAIFVANFAYTPNRIALRFLLDEVMPQVWSRIPEAKLALVGAGLTGETSSDPRVETLGFVDDLRSVYTRCSCAVVPLLKGGGTPLKLIEALAYGLPVIATSRAAAGLQLHDGEHYLLADDASAFAAALTRVLRQGAPELGNGGRRLVEQRHSVAALAALLAP